jgi:hypothetical protein
MSVRTSCIEHPAENPMVIIRADFLAICEGDHCRAALLAVFEWWTNVKRGWSDQARATNDIARSGGMPGVQDEETWIWKTADELSAEMLGLYSERSIRPALKWLTGQGFISVRRNPVFRWDATPQYMLNVEVVNAAIRNAPHPAISDRQKRASASGKNGQIEDGKNGQIEATQIGTAIPEITPERTEKTPAAAATTRARVRESVKTEGQGEGLAPAPAPPAVYATWEATGALLSGQIAEELADAVREFGEPFVIAAIEEMGKSGARNLKYLRTILDSCRRDGRMPGAPRVSTRPPAAQQAAKRAAMEDPDNWVGKASGLDRPPPPMPFRLAEKKEETP